MTLMSLRIIHMESFFSLSADFEPVYQELVKDCWKQCDNNYCPVDFTESQLGGESAELGVGRVF